MDDDSPVDLGRPLRVLGGLPVPAPEGDIKGPRRGGRQAPALSSFPGIVVPRGLGNVAPLAFFIFMVVLTSILLLLVRPAMRLPGWTTGRGC